MTSLEIILSTSCALLVLAVMYLAYDREELRKSFSNVFMESWERGRRLQESASEIDDLQAHITALSKQIELRKPHRGPKGLFIKKPKHNSATDPVVQQFRDA